MLARVCSAAVLGIDAYLVDVEIDISSGMPTFNTVGLPQGAVKEGKERVAAALANAGYALPLRRITVNLAPADVPKQGSAFDLPIALGVLIASEQLPGSLGDGDARHTVVAGELGLEGDLRPVRGALPIALAARASGATALIVPLANVPEAAVVAGISVLGASSLAEVCRHVEGDALLAPAAVDPARYLAAAIRDEADFADVRGQQGAKRALEVAAAGAHNIPIIENQSLEARAAERMTAGFSVVP